MNEKPTILFVEDEEEIRENIRIYLRYKEYEPIVAFNGEHALELLKTHQPDLILSDMVMPKMDGMQLLRNLSKNGMDIPVVIVTAHGTMDSAIAAMKNGACDFITKPIDLDFMVQVINKVLERDELKRQVKKQQEQLDYDMKFAARIQHCLLPPPIQTPAISIDYIFHPLIEIGGDYITMHKFHDKKVAIALYDVQGHGVSAALTATLIHHFLHRLLAQECPLPEILKQTNQFIYDSLGQTHMFITMAIVTIDLDQSIMTVANAGHPDLLFSPNLNGTIERIPSNNSIIGIFKELPTPPSAKQIPLNSGDRLILYTDGVTEANNGNGKYLGVPWLESRIKKYRQYSSTVCLQKIYQELCEFQSDHKHDDLTIVSVDIK